MDGVASGFLLFINPVGWDEFGDAVGGPLDFPVAAVYLCVVETALCRPCKYADERLIGVVALGV